jgi:hypothetical protein
METTVKARTLFVATALMEAGIGVALLLSPSLVAALILGGSLDGTAASVVARLAGAALLAIGVACWLAKDDGPGRATRGLVAALLLYNVLAAAVLAHAGLGLGLTGIGLWPATALHAAMAAWCLVCLRKRSV